MRVWAVVVSCGLVLGGSLQGMAQQQQQSGPRTLEGLLNSGEAQAPTATAEAANADAPDSGPKRPAGTLVRPKEGVKHPDLDKAWADYDAAVAKVTESMKAAIAKQFDAATAKGDLDAAEKWQTALEKFEKAVELPTEKETKAAVSAAVADFKKASDELTKAYETVVKSLTMEKKIAEAKACREERRLLGAQEQSTASDSFPDNEHDDNPKPEEGRGAGKSDKWVVLFRSRNPADWNRRIDFNGSYAMPLKEAPAGIRFLRLKREDNDAFIIIPMTAEALGSNSAVTDAYGWSGDCPFRWNAHHMGVYVLGIPQKAGQIQVSQPDAHPGWGFGHKSHVGDRQYFCWAGVEIPETIFEVAVKCCGLTSNEKKYLLIK